MSLEDTDAGTPAESTVADVPETAPKQTIDKTLEDAYDAAMARAESGSEEGGEEVEHATEGRPRARDGTFLPGKAKPNGAAPAQAAAPTGEEAAPEPVAETPPAVAKPHDAPPNTWRKEVAAEFGKLPENVREEIYRRENDFHKGIGQYKDAADFGTVMAQELVPYQGVMQQHGVNAQQVVKSLAASWNMLVTGTPQQKTQLVLQLVKDHGIDLASIGNPPPQGETPPTQEDPRLVAALQRLEKIEGNLTAQERQRAEADFATHVDAVGKFGSDPKNKHFTAVRGEMAALLNSSQATSLDDAYDKAIWINPDTRKLLLADQDKARADKAAAEAAAARKAAGANVTRRGTPPVTRKTGRIEDTLERRYDELMS